MHEVVEDRVDVAAQQRVDVADYNRDIWQLLYATLSWNWCGINKVQTKSTGFLLPIDAD